MTTQYTPILQLALPVTGELNGTWGDVVNDNITSMVEEAIAGLATISTWTTNAHTLTTADGVTDEARCAMLVLQTGSGGTALSGAGQVICPARTKLYVVKNDAAYAVTVKTSGGSGVAIAAGDTAFVFCDGTNVNACVTQIINGHITGNLTVDGNTTLGDSSADTVTINAGSTTLNDGGAIRFEDNAGGEYVAIKAPATVTATYTLTLPIDDGTNGQALITDGSGNLSWSTAASGDVYGPASATDNSIARFDGTTGKLIKDSGSALTWNGSLLTINGNTKFGSSAVIPGFAGAYDASLANNASLRGTNAAGSTAFELIKLNTSDQVVINNDGADAVLTTAATSHRWIISAEQMRLTSTGLGIGTSSPSYKLDVSKASAGDVARFTNAGASNKSLFVYTDATYAAIATAANAGGNNMAFNAVDNAITFATNSAVRATLDTSGNLGLGVTPSAWNSGYKAIQNLTSALYGTTSRDMNLGANVFVNSGGSYAYIQSSYATNYTQYNGAHSWYTAPSGTAGNAITFTQAMTLDASGNLLVGTTSNTPAARLYVAGGSLAVGTVGSPEAQITYDGTNAYLDARQVSGALVFRTGGSSEKMRIDSSGNVGIGTSSPTAKLEISGGASTPVLTMSTTGTSPGTAIKFLGNTVNWKNWQISTSLLTLAGGLEFTPSTTNGGSTFSAPVMLLSQDGNLGLGVTPSAWNIGGHFELPNSSTVSFAGTAAYITSNAYYGSGWVYKTTGNAAYYAQNSGQHQWWNAPSGTAGNAITFTQAMTLDASGNLGIGQTSPSARLDVNATISRVINVNSTNANGTGIAFSNSSVDIGYIGSAKWVLSGTLADVGLSTSGATNLAFGTNNTERMRIDSSGRVAIGTSTANAKLTSYYTSLATDPLSPDYAGLNVWGTSSVRLLFGTDPNSPYAAYIQASNTGSGFPIALNPSGGNVGIGTSSPLSKLHVNGADAIVRLSDTNGGVCFWASDATGTYWRSFTTDTFRWLRASGTESMRINSSGYVGINTSAPTAYLHVSGDSYLIGSGYGIYGNADSTNYAIKGSSGGGGTLEVKWYGGIQMGTSAGTSRLAVDSTGNVTIAQAGRATITTDNDGSFDMNAASNFKCTPTGTFALTFTNIASASGQSGYILLVNTGGYAITAAATTKVGSSFLSTVSTAGTYLLSYFSDATNVYVTTSGALS